MGGCLLKSEGAEELLAALESVRQHQRFRSRQITELCETIGQAKRDLDTLTARENATLRLIVDAKLNKEIAAELGISIKTVESHRTNLFRKLKVRSVTELVRYALRHGLVDIWPGALALSSARAVMNAAATNPAKTVHQLKINVSATP